jgi:anti-anti-sigma factor
MVDPVFPGDVFGADLSYREGQANLHLKGELDLAAHDSFLAALAEAESTEAPLVVVDMRELRFIDSCGIRALLLALERAQDTSHRVVFTQSSPAVERTLELAGVTRLLPR